MSEYQQTNPLAGNVSPLRRFFQLGKLEGMTIEEGFAAYWKNLVAKDSKLAAYPKSFQAQLKDAFTEGYKHGAAERQTEIQEWKNTTEHYERLLKDKPKS